VLTGDEFDKRERVVQLFYVSVWREGQVRGRVLVSELVWTGLRRRKPLDCRKDWSSQSEAKVPRAREYGSERLTAVEISQRKN
jgi:hypothetical protein